METIGNSVCKEEFDNKDKTKMDEEFYLEASSTFPLIAYKFHINFTVYNVNAAMMSNFYRHDDLIFS